MPINAAPVPQVLCFEKEMTPAVSAFLRNHTSAAYGVAGPLGAGDLAAFKRESSPNYVPGLKHSAASRLETETLRMVNRLCPQDFNVCGYAATRRDTQVKAAPHTPRPERSAIAARRRWRTEGKKGDKKAGGGGKGGGTAHGHWQAQRAMSGGDEPPPPPPPPCRDLSCTTRLGSWRSLRLATSRMRRRIDATCVRFVRASMGQPQLSATHRLGASGVVSCELGQYPDGDCHL